MGQKMYVKLFPSEKLKTVGVDGDVAPSDVSAGDVSGWAQSPEPTEPTWSPFKPGQSPALRRTSSRLGPGLRS